MLDPLRSCRVPDPLPLLATFGLLMLALLAVPVVLVAVYVRFMHLLWLLARDWVMRPTGTDGCELQEP